MSGHSKWATIKRKKGATDAKRGKIFTRAIHEVVVAVREGGGGDPNGNARLRFAIDRAKAVNMPNDTIDRAIKRATGELKDGAEQQELTYEGYGPGGAAVLVEVITDNKNRTVGEIRGAFTRAGGALGENGCVGWMFKKKGMLTVKKSDIGEEQVLEQALEAGAEDVAGSEEHWEITTDPTAFHTVRMSLEKSLKIETAELQHIPGTWVTLRGKEAESMIRLVEALDDLDDVLNVWTNSDIEEGSVE
ncbi:MAG: YebC/PmpR family DNA-binding transcriptional regulator [Deltaproteobacteria bacterium]|nr:YebC/PmpR family DNA-binding transcriptional regulator [Deltaproteobacteria bacterium]